MPHRDRPTGATTPADTIGTARTSSPWPNSGAPDLDIRRPARPHHDNTAARHDHLLAHLRAVGLGALADLDFRGLGNDVLEPVIVTGFHATRTH
ncbi:hypothetical protein ABR738_02810 [Streptomyces sp. Edi4]|uniref:hypothetical protein n=1 Tax=Streptomyces sp. Edi4 TaxID=3162527 RepID=UPI003305836D